ncbi:MAG: cysteine--tRNA ligase [Pedosphaera sp.]|nr:cysteine--tRNA ligase [Pedosphaera sp.]
MSLNLFNTLSRSLEPFEPLNPTRSSVGMYCCGPTVYDYCHIGNFRTFVFSDLTRRTLEFRGFSVKHVMNITDVEDKILRRLRETDRSLRDFTNEYEKAFLEDLTELNCRMPHHLPRATEYMPQMIDLVAKLLKRGIAYQTPDGSVWFSISNYQGCGCRYGQLVKLNFDEMRPGERVSGDEYDKEAAADFGLWKARVPDDGDVFWPSPWGDGRPGWHLECSAMSTALLGPSFDLHLGGEDLAFPHHEDEIAQSEGALEYPVGQRFVKYWLHAAHLLVEGKKMSKSLGNFFTLRDLRSKGYSGREIRQLLLSAHYRETFNFTLEGLDGARSALSRIDECVAKLVGLAASQRGSPNADVLARFTEAMDDDLNVSRAWSVVFDWVRDQNRLLATGGVTSMKAADAVATWNRLDEVLGLGRRVEDSTPADAVALLDARTAAKQVRDFAHADALRNELKAMGWLVEDTPAGPKLKRA